MSTDWERFETLCKRAKRNVEQASDKLPIGRLRPIADELSRLSKLLSIQVPFALRIHEESASIVVYSPDGQMAAEWAIWTLARKRMPQAHRFGIPPGETPVVPVRTYHHVKQLREDVLSAMTDWIDWLEDRRNRSDSADRKADNRRKTEGKIPANDRVLKLARKIKKEMPVIGNKSQIARDFCDGDEQDAKNLLRQLRRFQHLLK